MIEFGIAKGIGEFSAETEMQEISNGQLMTQLPGRTKGKMTLAMQDGGKLEVQVAPLALSPLAQFAQILHQLNKGDAQIFRINDNEVQAALNQVQQQTKAAKSLTEQERQKREAVLDALIGAGDALDAILPEPVKKAIAEHKLVLEVRQKKADVQAEADAMDDASREL